MFIASVTAFVFLMGVIHLVRAIPLYTASTQVLLERRERAPGLDAVVNDGRIDDSFSYVENQLAILRSDSLLRRVVVKERLGANRVQRNRRPQRKTKTIQRRRKEPL